MTWAILDTSIYIGHWERGLHEELLAGVRRSCIVRHSAIVLSELRRGARTRRAQDLVNGLSRLAAVQWEPTAADWWEAGRIIRDIGDERSWGSTKRRDFQNDTLIALTARRHGATVVTVNRNDFELLARAVRITVILA
ncbi:MAG TPA: type II toxin-antitoxin system VapC family toxin [Candidatus Acidoferrum sp.]|nr:type II toxin-antitoxin system VapC family toxin [Candidatus Acidoferrum sp.]